MSSPTPIVIPLTLSLFVPNTATMLSLIMVTLIVSVAGAVGLYVTFGRGGTKNPVLHFIGPTGETGHAATLNNTGPAGLMGSTGNSPIISTGSTGALSIKGPTGPQRISAGATGLTGLKGPTGFSLAGPAGAQPSGPVFGLTFTIASFYTSDNVPVMTGIYMNSYTLDQATVFSSMGSIDNIPLSTSLGNGGLRLFLGVTGANYGHTVAYLIGNGWRCNPNERFIGITENSDYISFYFNDYIAGTNRPVLNTDVTNRLGMILLISV